MAKGDERLHDEKFTEFRDELNDLGVFNRLIDVLIFLAGLGLAKNDYVETHSKSRTGPAITGTVLNGMDFYFQSLAMHREQDVALIRNKDKCYEIFSGYVNGGFQQLEIEFDSKKAYTKEEKINVLHILLQEEAMK